MKNRNQLPNLLDRTKPAHVVEIGVYRGKYTNTYSRILPPGSQIWLVDPWTPNRFYQAKRIKRAYNKILKKYAEDPNVHIVQYPSIQASKLFPPKFFDWVYIDADHHYKQVLSDIKAWLPRCRYLMSGHDYVLVEHDSKAPYRFGVRKAVQEIFGPRYQTTKEPVFKSWYVKLSSP